MAPSTFVKYCSHVHVPFTWWILTTFIFIVFLVCVVWYDHVYFTFCMSSYPFCEPCWCVCLIHVTLNLGYQKVVFVTSVLSHSKYHWCSCHHWTTCPMMQSVNLYLFHMSILHVCTIPCVIVSYVLSCCACYHNCVACVYVHHFYFYYCECVI